MAALRVLLTVGGIHLKASHIFTPPSVRSLGTTLDAVCAHDVELADAITAVEAEHAAEVAAGHAAFGHLRVLVPWRFDERSFTSPFNSSEGLAPDRCCGVFATVKPLMSSDECDALIEEASAAMVAGVTSRFTYTAESRLGEVHASELPGAQSFLVRTLPERFWPLLASRYDVAPEQLVAYDALIVRYSAASGGVRQPTHRDAALFTVNVALSDRSAYQGGGTWIESERRVALLERGYALCHSSDIRHAGHRLTAGERWVLVVFAIRRDQAQLPSRLAERAADARRSGQLELSSRLYAAALERAPLDHALHYGSAISHAQAGDAPAARLAFARALELYPHCPRPCIGLGSLLLEAGRKRAALRHFDRALALAADEDEVSWWEAALNAALCATLLASEEAEAASVWHERLVEDIARLRRIVHRGGDERASEMLLRAQSVIARRQRLHP